MTAVQMEILPTDQAASPDTAVTRVGGRVEHVIYANGENGYCVLSVEPSGCDGSVVETFTAVGYLASIRDGDEYLFTGTFKAHAKFGRQFCFDSAEVVMPSSREGIITYLADISYGVGPVRAAKIVDALGDSALTRIQDEPSCLDSLAFLTATQRAEIRKHLTEHKVQAELAALICRGPGITPGLAARIFRHYGEDSVAVVKSNPYVLADEIWGVGFLTADKVARAVGIPPDSAFRVEAAVEYVIKEASNEGHCFLRPRDIVPRVEELLGKKCGIGVDNIALAAGNLIESKKLVREDYAIYTTALHRAESELATRINILLGENVEVKADIDSFIDSVEARWTREGRLTQFHPSQQQAIKVALTNAMSILCGAPGVGKSFTIRAIVEIYHDLYPGKPIYLAAPTGRAAKRITELTDYEAKTIHRLLEYHPEAGFRINAENPLKPGLLCVDELSMLELELANQLFSAITPKMQVVLVGDPDQLPSVGPGSVLRDLISCQKIPVTRLQYVYRQAAGSEIHRWAHSIKDGIVPPLVSNNDVTVICCQDQESATQRAVEQAKKAVASFGMMGFGVLAPMKKGVSGVAALNEEIRQAVNPYGLEMRLGAHTYRLNDRAMILRNDYDLEVFNGDLGQVVAFDDAGDSKAIILHVDGRQVRIEEDKANILTLAYASTVHKFQGSEVPCVIVVLTRGHWILLKRPVLYTAVTRARQHLVVIHQPGSIEKAVSDNMTEMRYSNLTRRLQGEWTC